MPHSTYPATRSSWRTSPMDEPKLLEVRFSFTSAEYEQLIQGLIPRDMEERWFIFFEDGWLHFHRSWSGYEIYRAPVIARDGQYVIESFLAERNANKYSNTEDLEDVRSLTVLIHYGLLGNHARVSTPTSTTRIVKDWSNFGTMMFPNNSGQLEEATDYTC